LIEHLDPRDRVVGPDRIHHVETLHHATEHGVASVEVARLVVRDEELRAAGVLARERG
jgi:hypothetical protein